MGFSCVNFALIFLWVFVHYRFMVVVVGCYCGGGVGCCRGGLVGGVFGEVVVEWQW